MLQRIAWGTKYGRFTTINISKYEHFTLSINIIYSHLLCPLWFPAFSVVLSLLFVTVIPVIQRSKSKCAALTSSHNKNNSELGTLTV